MDHGGRGTELPIGDRFRSNGRTVGEGEFALLSDLTWNTAERHTNREVMSSLPVGERVLAGPIVVSIVASLAALGPLSRVLEQHGIRTVAALGLEAEFVNDVHPGDTLWADSEINGLRPSRSRPGGDILTIRDWGCNQHDTVVVAVTRSLLVERRGG